MSAAIQPRRGLATFAIAPPAGRDGATAGVKAAGLDWVFWLAVAAIISQLTISSNLLRVMAIPYNAPGGLPIWKFHPGTYLAFLALAMQLRRPDHPLRDLMMRIARQPHFPLSGALMVFCSFSCALTAGVSGSAVYIESYLSAAVLGFVLIGMTVEQRRTIGRVMIGMLVLNVLICLAESVLKARLIPIILTDASAGTGQAADVEAIDYEGEFRGTAFFDHPLTGAMMTMMGTFLCLSSDLRPRLKVPALLLMMIGLIAFGGRTALGVTYLLMAAIAAVDFGRRLVTRRIDATYVLIAILAAVVIPLMLGGLLLGTSLGERIAGKLFFGDDSAQARVVEWYVLGDMSAKEHAFGIGPDRMVQIIERLGLTFPFNDIENFWLLSYINLGIVGFLPWLVGFMTMLRGLAKSASVLSLLLLLSLLLVASTSNSLGRKSNILFIATAAAICTTSFRQQSFGAAARQGVADVPMADPPPRSTGLRPFRIVAAS